MRQNRSLSMLIAADSFKGSATSAQVAAWIGEGIAHAVPDARITVLPIADGGEGTVASLYAACGGELRTLDVAGPLGQPVQAEYLLATNSAGRFAVIEMAAAAGIGLTARTNADALVASTRGVGELLLDAVARGAQTVYLGLGGSSTNDGGAGFLAALGAVLSDAEGREVEPGLAGIAHIASVDLSPAYCALNGVSLVGLTDVTNPLTGTLGALAVFGPQKGLADPQAHDPAMSHYADLLDAAAAQVRFHDAEERDGADGLSPHAASAKPIAAIPGSGAAGGLGAAVLALGGQLKSGIEAVLDLADFDALVATADLVITGEGHMDSQTAGGKAPVGVARRAKRAGKPVIAIVGGRAQDLDAVYDRGIDLVIPAPRKPLSLEEALTSNETHANLFCAGETAARAFLLR